MQLGGRAAEELAFGGGVDRRPRDLVGATGRARRMVRGWGVSERLGDLAWGTQAQMFLGEDLIHTAPVDPGPVVAFAPVDGARVR